MPRIPATFVSSASLWLALTAPAAAQPANDAWADSTQITALPFAPAAFSADAATSAAGDPALFCKLSDDADGAKTVWYGYTTGAATEFVDIAAGGFDSVVGVYTGSPADGFSQVAGGLSGMAILSGLAPGLGMVSVAGARSSPEQMAVAPIRDASVNRTRVEAVFMVRSSFLLWGGILAR